MSGDLRMSFDTGDRVRCTTTGDDGLPLVRYGFVRSLFDAAGPAVVMLDGDISSEMIALDALQPVAITTVTLSLDGDDLLTDPELRGGLLTLWAGEAERAGLDVADFAACDVREDAATWQLGWLQRGDDTYVLRARNGGADHIVSVRAELAR